MYSMPKRHIGEVVGREREREREIGPEVLLLLG